MTKTEAYRSTVLSRVFTDRTLTASNDGQTLVVQLWRGLNLSCFTCHDREDDGRPGGVFSSNHAPVVSNLLLQTPENIQGGVVLDSTDSDGHSRTYRIVQQPQHGAVALSETAATHYPESGYTGPDSFTYVAFDGFTDSNLGIVLMNGF